MATTTRSQATEADLLGQPQDGRKYELVDGEIRVSPAGALHGHVSVALATRLHVYVKRRRLGHVFDSSTGFRLPGGNVRSPDVSLVAAGRFKAGRPPEGFVDFAPDLAVEVLSPEDRPRDLLDKVGEYLEAGTRLVWVVDPNRRRATSYRSLTDVREIGTEGILQGEDVLPGFRCKLRSVLED